MKKLLPLGISDFKEIVSGNYYYVDKTLLIKELYEGGKVFLVTRPRRFGKTLNLSMLRYFFEQDESNDSLFLNTAIWQVPEYREKQGQFPVIFVTFKNIFQNDFELMLKKFEYTIAIEFERHAYLVKSDILEPHEKEMFNRVRTLKSTLTDLSSSLEFLARMLHKYHKKKVVVLVDEYDVPVQAAYIYKFYDELIAFLKELLSGPFKDQNILEKGVITGNLTLAKAGIFTGLNNLTVFNVLNTRLADKFGFTFSETEQLLSYYDFKNMSADIESWYDGYKIGLISGIFNPWSLLNCIFNNGDLSMYWANTSDNILLRKLIGQASPSIKSDLELLLQGQSVRHSIEESVIFPDLDKESDLIWSLLLFTGYLTFRTSELKSGKYECDLIIPNEEIKYLYKDLINKLFKEFIIGGQVIEFLKAITQGNTSAVSNILQGFILNSMSSFDIPDTEPEKSYHLFILGLLNALSDEYLVKSNNESGYGRYDIMLIPKNLHKTGVVIEFKKVWSNSKGNLEEMAQAALDQIIEKKYAQELHNHGIQTVIAYGISFEKKNLFVKSLIIKNT